MIKRQPQRGEAGGGLDRGVESWLPKLEAMLSGCDSLAEFRARLDAAYGELPADAIRTSLAQELMVAHLEGMADPRLEADHG